MECCLDQNENSICDKDEKRLNQNYWSKETYWTITIKWKEGTSITYSMAQLKKDINEIVGRDYVFTKDEL